MTERNLLAGVREEGTVEGYYIETYYVPCKGIITDKELRVLKVVADDGATDTETRVLFETLIEDGWTPPGEPAPCPFCSVNFRAQGDHP